MTGRSARVVLALRKHFALGWVAVVIVCAALAATAVAHLIEAIALPEPDRPISSERASSRPPAPAATSAHEEDGTALVERNMFCSDCPARAAPAAPAAATGVGDQPPLTTLSVRLIATSIAPDGARSFATVLHVSSNAAGAYRVGEEIPGAGPIVSILGRFVDFENRSAGRIERIALSSTAGEPSSAQGPAAPADLAATVAAGIARVDESSFLIARSAVAQALANPTSIARGARIQPTRNGLRLYAIRSSSVFAALGLQNGDVVHAVNGLEITSLEKGLEMFTRVRESNSLSVAITRRGKPVTLSYSIR
jgi:general secretion pathway protein C